MNKDTDALKNKLDKQEQFISKWELIRKHIGEANPELLALIDEQISKVKEAMQSTQLKLEAQAS